MSKTLQEEQRKQNSNKRVEKQLDFKLKSTKSNLELLKIMQYYSTDIADLESNYNNFSKLISSVR